MLGLYLSAPVYAFTPSDSPLLSAAAVAPNVMLLIDDSGSMNNIIWAPGFDPTVNRAQIANCSSNTSCSSGQNLDMSNTNILLSSLNRGGCSTSGNWYGFYRGFLGLSSICLKLPDPVGNENTRYTADYLSYLVGLANGSNRDFTSGTGAIPNDYRISVATGCVDKPGQQQSRAAYRPGDVQPAHQQQLRPRRFYCPPGQ